MIDFDICDMKYLIVIKSADYAGDFILNEVEGEAWENCLWDTYIWGRVGLKGNR